MIDTMRAVIPYNRISITNPKRFGGELELQAFEGYTEKSMNNNPTDEDIRDYDYMPRMTLISSKYGICNSHKNLYIECSLPKILFGNSIEELDDNDFDEMILSLRTKMDLMGVYSLAEDIKNAYVQRVDCSKNFIIDTNPLFVIKCLSKIKHDSRLEFRHRDYQNGGKSITWSAEKYHMSVYDKLEEIKNCFQFDAGLLNDEHRNGKDIYNYLRSQNKYILRYEICLKRDKLEEFCKKATLKNVFNAEFSKNVLSRYIPNMNRQLKTFNINTEDIAVMLDAIRAVYPGKTENSVMSLLGYIIAVNKYGYTFVRSAQSKKCSSFMSELKKQIDTVVNRMNSLDSVLYADLRQMELYFEDFTLLRFNNLS